MAGASPPRLLIGDSELGRFPPPILASVTDRSVASTFGRIREIAVRAGYEVTSEHPPRLPLTHHLIDDSVRVGHLVAERSVLPDLAATSTSRRAAGVLALLALGLGTALAILGGNLSWFEVCLLLFGLPALLVLSIWGTAYVEDGLVVEVEVPVEVAERPDASVDRTAPHTTRWLGGRVRSRIRSRRSAMSYRSISTVEADPRLTDELRRMVAEFPSPPRSAGESAFPNGP